MTWVRRIGERIGRRGDTLLFLALVDLVYGLSLFFPPPEAKLSPTLAFIAHVIPLWAWAAWWTLTGIVCVAGAFMRHDRWAFTAAAALKALWGSTFLFGWALGGLDRGWVSAAIWLVMARWAYRVASWPEPMDIPLLTGDDV